MIGWVKFFDELVRSLRSLAEGVLVLAGTYAAVLSFIAIIIFFNWAVKEITV